MTTDTAPTESNGTVAEVTVKIKLHQGDIEAIRAGKYNFGDAIELVLNHKHGYEIIKVEELP